MTCICIFPGKGDNADKDRVALIGVGKAGILGVSARGRDHCSDFDQGGSEFLDSELDLDLL